MRSFVLY